MLASFVDAYEEKRFSLQNNIMILWTCIMFGGTKSVCDKEWVHVCMLARWPSWFLYPHNSWDIFYPPPQILWVVIKVFPNGKKQCDSHWLHLLVTYSSARSSALFGLESSNQANILPFSGIKNCQSQDFSSYQKSCIEYLANRYCLNWTWSK